MYMTLTLLRTDDKNAIVFKTMERQNYCKSISSIVLIGSKTTKQDLYLMLKFITLSMSSML